MTRVVHAGQRGDNRLGPQPAAQQQPQTKEQTVYVTKTGKKYHTATCRYLANSKDPHFAQRREGEGLHALQRLQAAPIDRFCGC